MHSGGNRDREERPWAVCSCVLSTLDESSPSREENCSICSITTVRDLDKDTGIMSRQWVEAGPSSHPWVVAPEGELARYHNENLCSTTTEYRLSESILKTKPIKLNVTQSKQVLESAAATLKPKQLP
ncbi:hypothetical protein INR49_011291 [Caranx melampygus]|nr:hypothetical protein INR49_011291 [Caranx melampygus]